MRALLDAVEGAPDPVRLAVLVLASRTPDASGVVVIRTRELGRWLGLSKSRTASAVVPGLRASGVVEIVTEEGEFGQSSALSCRVLPLYAARGVVGDRLALSRTEFAVLWALMNAVAAPGWRHKDKPDTEPGLLGTRTGRGSATDRLALLLLVLEATPTGRVRRCGGAVDKRYGRLVRTLARLLGCGDPGAERVLERLEDAGLVERRRLGTTSGLYQRTRLVVPAVAAAHRGQQADPAVAVVVAGAAGAAGTVREERATAGKPGFSDPDDAATGGEAPEQEEEAQFSGGHEAGAGDFADPDDAAALHTDHSSGVSAGVLPRLSGGFSGVAAWGGPGLPDRACEHEDGQDQAADCGAGAAESVSAVVEAGPLRGEKPEVSPAEGQAKQRATGGKIGGRLTAVRGEKAQQRGRAALPDDLRLRVALEPAAWLWEQMNWWQQGRAAEAADAELGRLADLLMQPETAPQLLADRLADRLEETGGEALVKDPFGWLTRRGLVQRRACSDQRCDDGIRLDTGTECQNCGNVVHLRRACRARIAAEIDRELPGLGEPERRQVLEERLREQAALEAEDFTWRHEQAAAERARRDAARAAAAAAGAVRQALPCEDCGQQRSGGLCEACGYRRRTEAAIVEAGLTAATWSADLTDPGDVAAVTADVRVSMEREIAAVRADYLRTMDPADQDGDPAGTASVLAFGALHTAEQALPEYRRNALAVLGRTEEADAEAERAYATEQRRRWFRANPGGADALAAAEKAAGAARERTALYLLGERLEQLRAPVAANTARAGAVTA